MMITNVNDPQGFKAKEKAEQLIDSITNQNKQPITWEPWQQNILDALGPESRDGVEARMKTMGNSGKRSGGIGKPRASCRRCDKPFKKIVNNPGSSDPTRLGIVVQVRQSRYEIPRKFVTYVTTSISGLCVDCVEEVYPKIVELFENPKDNI